MFETDTTAPMVQAVANELVSAFRVACEQVKPTGWILNCVYGNNATFMATQGKSTTSSTSIHRIF